MNLSSFAVLLSLLVLLTVSQGFGNVGFSAILRSRSLASSSALFAANPPAPPAPADDPYHIWVCVSCQYEYNEEKGFKKRIKPGTRMRDMETFACPVCGAAKDQFAVKE